MIQLSNRLVTLSSLVAILSLAALLASAQGGSGRETTAPAAKKTAPKKRAVHRRARSSGVQDEERADNSQAAVPPVIPRPTPMPGELQYNQGLRNYFQSSYSDAIGYFKEAIASNPSYYKAYNYLGNCYYFTNRYDEAATAYERLLGLVTNDSSISDYELSSLPIRDVFTRLSYSYRKLGRDSSADEVQRKSASFCALRKC